MTTQELESHYLCPAGFLCKRDFSDSFQKFRGAGCHFFSLPAILTLYVLGREDSASVKLAIYEGVKACEAMKVYLDDVDKVLAMFELSVSCYAHHHLLRNALKLQPVACSTQWLANAVCFNITVVKSCMLAPHQHLEHADAMIQCIGRLVWRNVMAFQRGGNQNKCVDARDITETMEECIFAMHLLNQSPSWANNCMLLNAAWASPSAWNPQNHLFVASSRGREIVKAALIMLGKKGITCSDLVVQIIAFVMKP